MDDAVNDASAQGEAPLAALLNALRQLDDLLSNTSGAGLAVGSVVSAYVHAHLNSADDADHAWLLVLVNLAISAATSELSTQQFLERFRAHAQSEVERQAEVEEIEKRIEDWLSGLQDDDEPRGSRFGM